MAGEQLAVVVDSTIGLTNRGKEAGRLAANDLIRLGTSLHGYTQPNNSTRAAHMEEAIRAYLGGIVVNAELYDADARPVKR
jgi:hypothetical protein